jgi:hypothetical protein
MGNNNKYNDNPFEYAGLQVTFEVLLTLIGLSATSLKLFIYIRGYSFKDEGIVYLDKQAAKEHCEFKQDKSVYNALSELADAKILARSRESFEYYYNPKFITNQKEA